jgi:glycosyl transferase family 25
MPGTYPIFVISLEDAAERRQDLMDQLQAQGLTAQMFPAIDARKGVPAALEHLVDRPQTRKRMRRDMSAGEYGCALSHRTLYEKIVTEGLPGAIILEDDAIPHPSFGDFVRAGDAEGKDMVVFDYIRVSVSRWREQTVTAGVKLHQLFARSTRTTGYAVSQNAARKLLAETTPISHAADWPCDLYTVGAWATYPKLIDHPDEDEVPSTISADRATLTQKSSKHPMRHFRAEHWRKKIAKRVG